MTNNNYICFIYLQGWADNKETRDSLRDFPTHIYFNAGQKRYVPYFSFNTKEECENWIATQDRKCYEFVHDWASKWSYQNADLLPFAVARDLPKTKINPDVLKLAERIKLIPTNKVWPSNTEVLNTLTGKDIPLNWGEFSLKKKSYYSKKLGLALQEIITEVNKDYFYYFNGDLSSYCSSVLCNTLNYVKYISKEKDKFVSVA